MILEWLALFLSFVSIIWLIVLQTQKGKLEQTNSILEETLKQIETQVASNKNRGPQGPPGKPGPQGLPGTPGATYVARGTLQNVKYQGDLVLDRLHGQGIASVAFLNASNLQPNQQWIYQSDGTIRNQYDGSCLTGDTISRQVFQAGCAGKPNQNWVFNSYGQLISKEDSELCLDTTFDAQFQGTNKIVQGQKLDKGTTHANLQRVTLKNCNKGDNLSGTQQWVFS